MRGNRLAVASLATGKVHLFDCTDPAKLKPLGTIGRGDGPYGPILADRFYFQEHPLNTVRYGVVLDLAEDGTLTVRDYFNRTIVFDPQGKAIYESFAQFGNWPARAYFQGDDAARFFDSGGDVPGWLTRSGAIGSRMPAGVGRAESIPTRWGFSRMRASSSAFFTTRTMKGAEGCSSCADEKWAGRAVAFYTQGEVEYPPGSGRKRGMWVVCRDTNGDGRIDAQDAPGTPVLDGEGKPIAWNLDARFLFMLPDGSLVSPGGSSQPSALGYVWRRKGLDAGGLPVYQFGADSLIPVQNRRVPSAYNWSKTEDLGSQSEATFAPGGDYLATFQFGGSPNGMGLSNSGAIDLARFDPAGRMKWLRPLNDFGPIQGVKASEKFILTSWGHQAEWIGMDPNGLGLGHLGFPAEAGWEGYWVDHPTQYFMFPGNDGGLHVLVGDYMQNCQHWLSLENYGNYRFEAFPVRVTPAKARELSFRPAVAVQLRPKPAQPRITIRKLPGPLPIDGKLAKVARHRPANRDHSGDQHERQQSQGRQRGDPPGLPRAGPLRPGPAVRQRGHLPPAEQQEPPARHAGNGAQRILRGIPVQRLAVHGYGPRDHPAAVLLRQARETPGGRAGAALDRSPSQRQGRERAAPHRVGLRRRHVGLQGHRHRVQAAHRQDDLRGRGGIDLPRASGSGMWIGFMIDDNDVPGSDNQKMLVWPATYNTFGVKERGAYAVFE